MTIKNLVILMKDNRYLNSILQVLVLTILIWSVPEWNKFTTSRLYLAIFSIFIDILVLVFFHFFDLITRPLLVIVKQKNGFFDRLETNISLSNNGTHKTREKERIVKLEFIAKKSKSSWSNLLSKLFIKYKISLRVKPICNHVLLQPLGWAQRNDIELEENGFKIKYYKFLDNINKVDKTEIVKNIDFTINCEPTAFSDRFDIFLEYCDTKNKMINLLIKILMKSEIKSLHTINIKRG